MERKIKNLIDKKTGERIYPLSHAKATYLSDGRSVEEVISDLDTKSLIHITYSELRSLRDNSELVPGMSYRITDYITTTTEDGTKAADNQFDVIVLADDVNVLSHIARATKHDGITYFDSCDLESWQLWYDIDNDTDRYAWADAENGTGVIYRMIDDKGNDCPYDFKNILFYTDKYSYNKTLDKYYYTFSYVDDNSMLYDGTTDSQAKDCYGNVIKEYKILYSNKQQLNKIIFRNISFSNACYSNTFESGCYLNTFESECYLNTFGNSCYSNTFGNNCYSNTFDNYCQSNILGVRCIFNKLGVACCGNEFDYYIGDVVLENECKWNKIKQPVDSNSYIRNLRITSTTSNREINPIELVSTRNIVVTTDIYNNTIQYYEGEVTIPIREQTNTKVTIYPNTLNIWGEVTSLEISLAEGKEGIVNEYMAQFISGDVATTLILPSNIKWVSTPNIQPNKIYQLSIVNNLGIIGEFEDE